MANTVEFGGLLGYAPIMPVNKYSCDAFRKPWRKNSGSYSTALRTNMIKAVIFDMDGVLIDTEKYYIQLGMDITKEMGYEIPREKVFIHAKPKPEIFQADAVRKIRCGF